MIKEVFLAAALKSLEWQNNMAQYVTQEKCSGLKRQQLYLDVCSVSYWQDILDTFSPTQSHVSGHIGLCGSLWLGAGSLLYRPGDLVIVPSVKQRLFAC